MEGFQPIISPARIDPLSGFSVTKLPDCKESVYNFFPPKLAKEINKWESKKMNEVWVEKQIDILLE
ncbi:MAG: hypothetical protein LBF15_05280 [Candidatus Peribacteria bacterium]|jgi:hypothetical protein|nr:hypothetical protein [Candidatus Peribacteria bacterium]